MTNNQFDPNQLFDADYFRDGFGGIPYERSEHWVNFFGTIARHILQDFVPQTVLDAGCGIGLLVEALRNNHIDAHGFDIADYAIGQVPDDLRPFVKNGSITDPNVVTQKFDLVVCIEVVEHLPPEDADAAINNLCQWSDTVLFSSSPDHYDEPTHFNVQLPGYWVEKFARNGFIQVLDYDANYITPWTMLFRRQSPIWPTILRRYANLTWSKTKQTHDLRNLVNTIQHTRYTHEQSLNELQHQLQRQQADYDTQVTTLQTELDTQQTAYQSEIATLHETIRHLQQSIETLESEHQQATSDFQAAEAEFRQELARQVLALENAHHEREQLLTDHSAAEDELRQTIAKKEADLGHLQHEHDQHIAQYEAILAELRQQLKDQQEFVQHSQYEHGRLLATNQAVEAELRRQIEEQLLAVENAHVEQGRLIGTHSQTETYLQQQIEGLQTALETALKENLQQLSTHRNTEAQLRHDIGSQQSQIADLQHQLETTTGQLQAEIDTLDHRLSFAHANISVMRSTRGWRILESWWRWKKRIFPPRSRRERFYNLFRSAVEIFFKYGPWALVTRFIRWLRRNRRPQHVDSPISTHPKRPSTTENQPKIADNSDINMASGFLIHPVADAAYAAHIQDTEPTLEVLEQQRLTADRWTDKPLFSIVTPVYQPQLPIFKETLQSVQSQTYQHWVWYLVDASPDDTIWDFLVEQARRDQRLKPIRITENLGIAGNTNIGLKQAIGDYVVMFDHDDTLAPHALFSIATLIRQNPDADFIYSDMDKLDERGRRCEPLFKPDWSPELLLCANFLCQISVFRRILLDTVGYLDPKMDGAQDWDFYLRFSEHTQKIYHIPQVLYHWRKSPQSTAQSSDNKPFIKIAQSAALTNHLRRRGLNNPQVTFDNTHPIHNTYPLVTWQSPHNHCISIIIPTKDHLNVLKPCLKSIFDLTTYPDFQVILVDTGSVEPATEAYYQQYKDCENFKLVRYSEPFNFSKACNCGAQRRPDGDLLLFLNNDTVVLEGDWLQRMAQWFDLDEVGIVGPKLRYPNGKIQHSGVILGMGALAGHIFADEPEHTSTMFGSDGWYRNLLAVTGACLMISRQAFNTVGGFDEAYQLNYSDVELGLRVHEAGYRNVYTPHVCLLHHESATHNRTIPRADFERASQRWAAFLEQGDPYFNPNLSYSSATPTFSRGPHDIPQHLNADLMARMPHKPLINLPDDLR